MEQKPSSPRIDLPRVRESRVLRFEQHLSQHGGGAQIVVHLSIRDFNTGRFPAEPSSHHYFNQWSVYGAEDPERPHPESEHYRLYGQRQ